VTGKPREDWTQNVTLNPEQQAAMDSQMAVQTGLSGQAQQFLGRVNEAYQQPYGWGNLPASAGPVQGGQLTQGVTPAALNTGQIQGGPLTTGLSPTALNTQQFQGPQFQGGVGGSGQYASRAGDALYSQLTSRLDPQFQQRTGDLESKLVNQGIARGSEAWDRESGNLERARTDAYGNAGAQAAQMAGAEASRLQGMDVTAGQFGNQAAQQGFQNQLAGQQAQNQALNQQFAQQAQAGQFGNQAQQQAWQQALGGQQAQNQALSQQFTQQAQAGQFGNAAQQQQWQQGMAGADLQNRLRQQGISEEQMQRSQPLNELNALLSGQQVGNPQFPSFNSAAQGTAANQLGAANMGYQNQLDQYNAMINGQNQQQQNAIQGGVGLGTLAMMAFGGSDRIWKTNIRPISKTKRGTTIYAFTMGGREQIGVIAQESPKDAVVDFGGVLVVDYSKV
jgi:hypothetical protein